VKHRRESLEIRRLRVFGNKMLRGVFESKREEVAGG